MPAFALAHRTLAARAGDGPHPGLLLLHGRGADENDLLPFGAQLDPRLSVVTARAPFRFPWGGFAWYGLDPRGVGYPEQQALERSIQLLREFLAQTLEAYDIDPRRLYLGGFSMGAVMAGTLALLEPERVAGAMVLSGYLPLPAGLHLQPERAAGHPFFVAHGALDQVIPVSFGRQARDYLAGTPVALTYREYPAGHEITHRELEDLSAWLEEALSSQYEGREPSPARPLP